MSAEEDQKQAAQNRKKQKFYVGNDPQKLAGKKAVDMANELADAKLQPVQKSFQTARANGYHAHPGQVPGLTSPPATGFKLRLDPELDKELNGKPPPHTVDRFFDRPVMNSHDVVRGLGLSKAMENRIRKLVARELLSSPNQLAMRKAIMSVLVQEDVDTEARHLISTRAHQLYQKVLQKSGYQETYTIDEMHELKKGEAKGGTYHARVTTKGKHRYYYDAGKYEEAHGSHSHGEDNKKSYIRSSCMKAVEKAGGECGVDAFRAMVQRYGAKDVHDAVRSAVDSGELRFLKGKFSRVTK